jgi:uncharacterized membrane protein YfcA
MTPLLFTLLVFAMSLVAGLFGSLVGVGGGIIVVPGLTLLMGVDIRFAIGASIVSVIATSSGAAASYVREGITNLRVAMLLETATAAGAIAGALLAHYIPAGGLYLLFGAVLVYTAWSMSRRRVERLVALPDAWADRLRLHGSYFDPAENRLVEYRVSRTKLGLATSVLAGLNSGLLGVGGGAIKVPVMNLFMGMPLKACTATSNFMIGVTAAASATVYFLHGDVLPFVAAPVAAGVLLGATGGAQLLRRLRSNFIRMLFVGLLLVTAVQMLWKGAHLL